MKYKHWEINVNINSDVDVNDVPVYLTGIVKQRHSLTS